MRRSSSLPLVLSAALAGALVLAASSRPSNGPSKVDPRLLDALAESGATEALVVLERQADLSAAGSVPTKEGKGRYVFERLTATAAATQGPLIAELAARGVEHRPFWIVNAVLVRGDRQLIEALAARRDVARIAANPSIELDRPAGGIEGGCPPGGVEAGVAHVGAPDLWSRGFTGQGVVVAGADTGYDWDHPALRDAYRGWDGASATHDHNWHDAIHSGGGVCGPDSDEPCDDSGHGTHTMGTMVGADGAQQVGVAPGARWIGCRNMNQGFGSPASYAECFEFFVAPTDLGGENPRPDLAPHVINNSWSCPDFEGCTDPNVLRQVVENTRAAGIVVVASAGNTGSGCSSVSAPPPIYEAAFAVGAVTTEDSIAGFSSRGPVTVDGSDRLKPEVSAPGVDVCSTVPGGGYGTLSGTSMAGPHVAGLVALAISARPCLAGEVGAIEDHIEGTAVPRTTAQDCGGVSGDEVPNNTYGWGSARAAAPGPTACPAIFDDGFESGDTSSWTDTVD